MNRVARALLGAAGLIGCVALLAGQARAESRERPAAAVGLQPQPAAVAPAVFGTIAVPINAKRFWDEWERARRDASSLPQMRNLVAPARSLSRRQQIAYVQSAVSKTIGWRSDATEYGRHDYWASAEETLRNGRGDMEDRAIVKMQALRTLGFQTSDLYLTLGRDSVLGPITVLIVRDGNDYLVLDDTGAPPYVPAHRPEFRPVLTFGYGASWVHAKPGTSLASRSSGARSSTVSAQ